MKKIKAIIPGTLDPITWGHIDIIKRASRIFHDVVVAVGVNMGKTPFFSIEQRVEMATQSLSDLSHVEVVSFCGLLIDFAKSQRADVIVRGLRAVSDFEYEMQLASLNRKMEEDIETLFLTPSEQYTYLSSSMVREIARVGDLERIQAFVPPVVQQYFEKYLDKKNGT